jgi:DNA-binding transcriptional MerR regulator
MNDDLLEMLMSQSNQNMETTDLQTSKSENELVLLESSAYFPIRELSLKTGVNSVTLRAWERRYGLLKPKRTGKGHRLYDQGDVQRVEGILRWIQQGVAVSKVRALLEQEVAPDGVVPSNEWLEWQVALVKASKAFQEDKIEQMYQQIFSQYPAEIAVRDWLLPSFEQLGKSAELAFCESVLLSCLVSRVMSLKSQKKQSQGKGLPKVLITGLTSQRVLWCYMAAAIMLDKGLPCTILPNAYYSDDWSRFVETTQVQSVLVFCENELAAKASDLINQMQQWQRPVVVVGASFWLSAHESNMTRAGNVQVYSEALEGVTAFMKTALGK